MGIFDFFKHADINQGIEEYKAIPGAVLLDVRTEQEYRNGHVPGSINVPLQKINTISEQVEDMDTPLFVYCQSGGRSRQASSMLEHMGYSRVKNIGGIAAYSGTVER